MAFRAWTIVCLLALCLGTSAVSSRGLAGIKYEHDVVHRELLHTTCTNASVTMTLRFIQNWNLYESLWELNFTNHCAYNLYNVTQFSSCMDLPVGTYAENFEHPCTKFSNCSVCQDKALDRVNVVFNGGNWTNSVCQMFYNWGACNSSAIQMYPGQRVTMYYINDLSIRPCVFRLWFASSPPTFVEQDRGYNCAVRAPDFDLPPGYECTITNGVINCPPA